MNFNEAAAQGLTVKDTIHGPAWMIWVLAVIFGIISIVMLTGHGAGLIAGYNTATEEEKRKYDEKKMCRIVGGGMAVITILILIMAIGANVLPATFAYVFFGVTIADVIVMIALMNTTCKKK